MLKPQRQLTALAPQKNIHCAPDYVNNATKTSSMSVKGDCLHESHFPERKTGEILAESRINSSSPGVEILDSSDGSEKWNLANRVSSLEPTEKRILCGIQENEIKRVRQKPRRVLPFLPPIVQEILRWSIHPDKVLRGAASVRHLLYLPTIKEESLSNVQFLEEEVRPDVLRVKRMLPSVLPTQNRALSSNQPTDPLKPLPNFKAEFRKRMLPSLPTIEEQTSPRLSEVESLNASQQIVKNEALKDLGLQFVERHEEVGEEELQSIKKKTKKTQQRRKQEVKENQNILHSAEKKSMVDLKLLHREILQSSEATAAQKRPRSLPGRGTIADRATEEKTLVRIQEKVKRLQKKSRSQAKDVSPNPHSTAERKLPGTETRRRVRTDVQRRVNEGLQSAYPEAGRTRPGILSADSHVCKDSEEMPRLRAKLARRSKAMFQASVITKEESTCAPSTKTVLLNIQTTREPLIPKPPSSSKPKVTRVRPTVTRPLPSIPPKQELMIPKPPSTPKRSSSARPNMALAHPTKLRPLSSIKPVEKQTLPSFHSSNQQSSVKFPLPSIYPKEN